MSWAHYLLQVNIYLVIFYCFYKLLLDRETYFVLNRLYLVSSGLFSLAIPFLRLELFSEKVVSDKLYISVSELNNMVSNYAVLPQTQEQYDWGRLIVIIYIIGAFIFLLNFAYQLFTINQLFSKADANDAFSFFNRKSVAENLPERDTVDLHEDIHIKQYHTVDVVFFEILGIITWFNPVIYIYKKSIKNIHEYLADEAAAKFQGDKEAYAILLLSKAFGVRPSTLINRFFTKSLIKKRIYMLHRQRSKKIAILKYGLFVPLFALTLVLSAATIRKNDQILAISEKIPLNDASLVVDQVIKAPLSVVNLAPKVVTTAKATQIKQVALIDNAETLTATKVENTDSWNGFYKYISEEIKYPPTALKKQLQGNTVINFSVRRGKISEMAIQNELGGGCDEEVTKSILAYDEYFKKDGNYSLKVSFRLVGGVSTIVNENASTAEGVNALQNITVNAYAPKEEADQKVYSFVSLEMPPSYPGGMYRFYEFLAKNIKYPQMATDNEIQGNVFCSFTVEKDGALTDIKIDRRLGFGTDEEAVRVLKLGKRWNPGMQNGRAVRVKYNLPIKFSLNPVTESKASVLANVKVKGYPIGQDAPLVVLDGELKENYILKDLDANTIASIDILKDATALSFYGKDGKNGAIVITTKKQKSKTVTATINSKN